MRIVDLRSDTVTKPTPAMRRAMAEAEVGDDVYGEDPTVNRLEALAAELLGFETALFMPSGTMTNQVALLLHLKRGQEVIAPQGAHIYEYEPGSLAVLSGGTIRLVEAPYGVPDPEAVREAIHTSVHQAPTGLIALENTHNTAGGTVVPLETQQAIQQVAREAGLPTHLDGARLFNAAAALGVEAARLAQGFTTVSICLSKGLGAPVGSLLLMPKELRAEAWRYRKLLGGGMRQAGVLAAAGILALTEGPKHLPRDHQMARALAEGLLRLNLEVDLRAVQTNMVYARVPQAPAFVQRLRELGVLANAMGPSRVRFVTHRDLLDEEIPLALRRIEQALQVA
ncbi:MAG: aminotransferase class I/II-fold pyridoxal phosphate-dependent enzyme [Meiothermus sp.]|uniref:threonine aldolase family protein n=2 Tax=Meiothermus sp. TaxID=1955249 RepID=UPI0025F2453D|nr:GntG family PLP-dependent aldolase [Meiothermus sp.]MCS7194891.1 aminotransferase class I/II-fold pyridoxal phosphate-dependent enzyme [Meiothermus sp.]MDW8091255.1 GntG family PLP-dependent aldolase [Meiothermus sp.]MDW8480374.1 GntG family PLP-dependent aldolase [Meiothermus sp.]